MSAAHDIPKPVKYFFSSLLFLIIISAIYQFLETKQIKFSFSSPQAKNSVFLTEQPDEKFYKVIKIVDGDTIDISDGNKKERVRLIGINSPESKDPRRPVECFGKEAAIFLESIALGKYVKLEYDISQARRDLYDRLLAYVYLEDGRMLNRMMLNNGYAYEYTYDNPYRYQKQFKQEENFARNNEIGLWAKDTCDGKKFPVAQ